MKQEILINNELIELLNNIVKYGILNDNSPEALQARLYESLPELRDEFRKIEESEKLNKLKRKRALKLRER